MARQLAKRRNYILVTHTFSYYSRIPLLLMPPTGPEKNGLNWWMALIEGMAILNVITNGCKQKRKKHMKPEYFQYV